MSCRAYSIRFPSGLVERLQQAARLEALRRRQDVTWVGLLREAAEKFLADESKGASQGRGE
jgi:predicted DNA-binding protein